MTDNQIPNPYLRWPGNARIRRARKTAELLGLRLSNLRSRQGTWADIWVLTPERTFDEVEAELYRIAKAAADARDAAYARSPRNQGKKHSVEEQPTKPKLKLIDLHAENQ
jgi:hypothetical protein